VEQVNKVCRKIRREWKWKWLGDEGFFSTNLFLHSISTAASLHELNKIVKVHVECNVGYPRTHK